MDVNVIVVRAILELNIRHVGSTACMRRTESAEKYCTVFFQSRQTLGIRAIADMCMVRGTDQHSLTPPTGKVHLRFDEDRVVLNKSIHPDSP